MALWLLRLMIWVFCFSGELAESRQTEVTIRDVDEMAMEILIEFCYTSHIVVEESNVQTLLPAACLLQLAEIQVKCKKFFVCFSPIFSRIQSYNFLLLGGIAVCTKRFIIGLCPSIILESLRCC
jgi:hypothetical protein